MKPHESPFCGFFLKVFLIKGKKRKNEKKYMNKRHRKRWKKRRIMTFI